ncbi:5-(carboxyamino)imidazole ribonucleotide synthase [Haloferax sp. MBLA0076]|uniref:N5-carboxyaminoimidazole ribonucleotide synthase n=1 Tax=Haloferax litoreum TaxID=2666140 RepID=A0A6A8GC92_9EURY|nr:MULTISPECIES: 5-(carboxyamino)imidazole ribonucleotide synthase [Haloferax]KAB1191961.1 5-(carboxyamino)imidazole ribonucleotide synthase [Haloferax sp. CBA1148]MRX20399.1 5-(carboxyamino)imidazole ribonucleotide synthase [Haloferax litoreum]
MTVTVPGPTLGVVGGGQLGRMLGEAAAPLGVDIVVLDPTPDCPAAAVADQIVGDFTDPEAMAELAARADALTFEIELADPDLLDELAAKEGIDVHPSPDALRTIEDKLVQKRTFGEADIPIPPFHRVDDADDLRAALDEFGSVMLKARTGGYDGRGNVPVTDPEDAEAAIEEVGGPAMAEAFVDFERELSVIGVRGEGEIRTFPVGENVHEEEILRETVVPARTTDDVREEADRVAREVLSHLPGRGVFGIELFETSDGDVLVNEVAPRPHNSGHWTIEGALCSQFEQHVRAVLGWPLGATTQRAPTVSANILGTVEESQPARLAGLEPPLSEPGVSLHWYGKEEVRPLRKMGHLTAVDTGDDGSIESLLEHVRELRDGLHFD